MKDQIEPIQWVNMASVAFMVFILQDLFINNLLTRLLTNAQSCLMNIL